MNCTPPSPEHWALLDSAFLYLEHWSLHILLHSSSGFGIYASPTQTVTSLVRIIAERVKKVMPKKSMTWIKPDSRKTCEEKNVSPY